MTFDPVFLQQTVNPEPVKAGLLDHHQIYRRAGPAFGPGPLFSQVLEQRWPVAALDLVFGELLSPRRGAGDQPLRPGQFQRYEKRGTIEVGGCSIRTRVIDRKHLSSPSGWVRARPCLIRPTSFHPP